MRNTVIAIIGGCLLAINPLGFSDESVKVAAPAQKQNITHGTCSVNFPSQPEHISEKMQVDAEGTHLQYDAYIASIDSKTIFMLLVAEYPDYVDENMARMSLEAFLNGILTHNEGNQLLFADLVLVQGHEGLDFFIRSGQTYFRGQALMVKNKLYLMAMECEVQNYDEVHYNEFVDSFLLN